jgi:hypothetical protein
MPRKQGVWRIEWDVCSRCGFLHPINMLFMQQGMKLCKDHGCYDDLSNFYRARIIAEILRDNQEGQSEKPNLFNDPQELRF